jgi:molybdate transport system permease protein
MNTHWTGLTYEEWAAILLSLKVSFCAVLLILPIGIVSAWFLARKKIPGKAIIDTFINLPLVLPPVVTGYLLLLLLGNNSAIGQWLQNNFNLRISFTWVAAVLASATVAFPLMVRVIRTTFADIDRRYEQVAATLGAPSLSIFFKVTLPLAKRGILAGSVLAFARCMGEFGATIMIAGNIPGETTTIPSQIFSYMETPGGMKNAVTLVVISVIISACALFLAEFIDRKHTIDREEE